MPKHEKVEMDFVGHDAHKHRYSNGREKNVWYKVYRCPVCDRVKRPLQNTSNGKTFHCDGTGMSAAERKQRAWRRLHSTTA